MKYCVLSWNVRPNTSIVLEYEVVELSQNYVLWEGNWKHAWFGEWGIASTWHRKPLSIGGVQQCQCCDAGRGAKTDTKATTVLAAAVER